MLHMLILKCLHYKKLCELLNTCMTKSQNKNNVSQCITVMTVIVYLFFLHNG